MYRFIIVGCGLGGLATAIAIARVGHEVIILEKTTDLQPLGAGINITPNATLIFKEWGILEEIRAKANVPHAAFMRSYKDSKELSRISLGPAIEERYKAPYFIIHRADLHAALLEEAKRLGVFIKLGSHIINFETFEPSVELSNGEKYAGDIIIGADGERSMCRDAILGYNLPSSDSGDHVFRITVSTEEVAKNEGLAGLVQPPCLNLWVGPGAYAMAYALKRDGLLNIVLTVGHGVSDRVSKNDLIPHRVDIGEAKEAFRDWDKKFQELLALAKGCGKWTLLATPVPAHWTHPDGNFTLLGDSAHAMLPFLGQGAAMAFEDAAVLGTLVSKVRRKPQLLDVLTIYEQLRKPRTTAIHLRSHAMRDVYAFDDGPLQQERDRQLLETPPFTGYPNFLADPDFQISLFGYNAFEEAEKAWDLYLKGQWPSTRGYWADTTNVE